MDCINCGKIFKLKTDLKRHLNKKIKCNRIIQCDNCKKEFKTTQNLNKHLNNKKPCTKLDFEMENKILKLEKEVLTLKLELKNKDIIQMSNITNINNGTINNGTIINNQINIFGNESIEHITKQVLEKEILKVTQKDYDECHRKKLKFREIIYPMIFIQMMDVHLLLTKLIYFSKKKNNTMKKENDKYYINGNDGWEEVDLEKIHIKTYTKHQEVLLKCEKLIVENKIFRKAVENYFGLDDEFQLKIETGNIKEILSTARYKLLHELLDYELENIDNLIIDHEKNIIGDIMTK